MQPPQRPPQQQQPQPRPPPPQIIDEDPGPAELASLRSALSEKVDRQLLELNRRMTGEMDAAADANKRLAESETMLKAGMKRIQDEIVIKPVIH
jgi:hypothetical protein